MQEARKGFLTQIQYLSNIERETSISINRRVDLAKAALYIAAEDDSLVSHSSVPLPIDAFIHSLADLSMGYCTHYKSSFNLSPESFLESIERYMYVTKVRFLNFKNGYNKLNISQNSSNDIFYILGFQKNQF